MIQNLTNSTHNREEQLNKYLTDLLYQGVAHTRQQDGKLWVTVNWSELADLELDYEKLFSTQTEKAIYNLEIAAKEYEDLDTPTGEPEEVDDVVVTFSTDEEDELNGKRVDELDPANHSRLTLISATVEQVYGKETITTETIWKCQKCNARQTVNQYVVDGYLDAPEQCIGGDCDNTSSSKFWLDEEVEEVYKQRIKLSDDATAEKQGEDIDAHLFAPLLDSVSVGEQVTVLAIPKTYREKQSNLQKERDLIVLGIARNQTTYEITEEEAEKFEEIIQDGRAEEVLMESLAPSIVGEQIRPFKRSVLFAVLSGGVDWMDNRSDLNIAGWGDPSTGKTFILKFIQNSVANSTLAEGGGTTSVGLLASANRDERTGQWYAHSGPFFRYRDVMVDELADMSNDQIKDLKSAIESQQHTITKADINQTLNTEGSFIATSNPKDGEFNRHEEVIEQIDFDPAILSRFDQIHIIEDVADEKEDKKKADSMVSRYVAEANGEKTTQLSPVEFGKFVEYLKSQYTPKPTEAMNDHISEKYAELREKHPNRVDTRNIDTIVRIAIVNARLNGRGEITPDDVDRGIQRLLENLVQLDGLELDY